MSAAETPPSTRPVRRRALVEATAAVPVALALLLWWGTARSPGVSTYDDGVYGASVDALRHGAWPFRDIYSSQGPLFLPLLWIARTIGLGVHWAPRLATLAAGLAVVLLVQRLALRLTDEWGALLAGMLAATSGVLFFTSAALAADAIATAFALAAFVAATQPSSTARRRAVVLCAGAALAVKSLLVLPPVAAAIWLVGRRLGVRAAARAALAIAAFTFVVSLPWGLGNVWHQYVTYHLHEQSGFTVFANFRLARVEAWNDDRILLLAAVLALAAVVVRRLTGTRAVDHKAIDGDRDIVFALWVWIVLTALVILLHSPLFVQHFTVLVPAAVVLAARYRPPIAIVLVVALLAVPGQGHRLGWRLSTRPVSAVDRITADYIRRIQPASSRIISDNPGVVWLAGRRVPPALVDTSYERIAAGFLTVDSVVQAADAPDVCAVVFESGRFRTLGGLGARLTGFAPVALDGGSVLVYVKETCRREPGGT